MKRYATLALLLLALTVTACNKHKVSPEEKAKWQKLMQSYNDTRDALVKKHQAALFPPADFQDRYVFTSTIQKILTADSKKPIVLRAVIEDIHQETNLLGTTSYIVDATSFFTAYPDCDYRYLQLHLKADEKDASALLNLPADDKDGDCCCELEGPLAYLVVKIGKVERADPDEDGDSVYEAEGELIEVSLLPLTPSGK